MWRALQSNPSDATIDDEDQVLDDSIETDTSVRWSTPPQACNLPLPAANPCTDHTNVVSTLTPEDLPAVNSTPPSQVAWSPAAFALLSGSILPGTAADGDELGSEAQSAVPSGDETETDREQGKKRRARLNYVWNVELARTDHSTFQAAFADLAKKHH